MQLTFKIFILLGKISEKKARIARCKLRILRKHVRTARCTLRGKVRIARKRGKVRIANSEEKKSEL